MFERISTVILEPDAGFRNRLRTWLEDTGDIIVVGEAQDKSQLLEIILAQRPHILIADLNALGGAEAVALIAARFPETRILILHGHEETDVLEALRWGAWGHLDKYDVQPSQVIAAIRAIHRGEVVISSALAGRIVDELTKRLHDQRKISTQVYPDLAEQKQEVSSLSLRGGGRMKKRRFHWLLAVLIVAGCLLLFLIGGGIAFVSGLARREAAPPIVSIITPPYGARIRVGVATAVHLQALAPRDPLVRLQLWADGQLAGDLPATGSFMQTILTWIPRTPGDHTLMAQAYTRRGGSARAFVRVQAVEASDRDNDGVPDDADACPDQPGILQAQGCSTVTPGDRDGDGVPDLQDQCPDAFGVAPSGGCPQLPDQDGDGLADGADSCPDQAGLPERQGCPDPGRSDHDGDGVVNDQDQCDDQPGPAGSLGCPGPSGDRDSDGIADDQDQCPDVAGVQESNGCPLAEADDGDGDGIPNVQDECPVVSGSAGRNGCPPWLVDIGGVLGDERRQRERLCSLLRLARIPAPTCTDSDGDNLMDADDRCPQQAGSLLSGGCPLPFPRRGWDLAGGSMFPRCQLFPSLCTDSDGDGLSDASDGCPNSPGGILGCFGPGEWGEAEGGVIAPEVNVEIQLRERLYTSHNWMFVYCYVEMEGFSPLRLPWDRHSLEREHPHVWNLGGQPSVTITTDRIVLTLSMRCFGMPAPEGPEVDLGRIVRHHPRDDWDGNFREAVSEGGTGTFTIYYRICRDGCD